MSFVYVIGPRRGPVKVGWASNPRERLAELQTGNPDQLFLLAVKPGDRQRSPLLDASEAAELLAVPKSWLLAAARRGQAPHIRLGRYVRFDADELRAWAVDKHHHGPR